MGIPNSKFFDDGCRYTRLPNERESKKPPEPPKSDKELETSWLHELLKSRSR